MESKGIKLSVFTPEKGGFGIFVSRIEGGALDVLRPFIHNCPIEGTKIFTRSERLKRTETAMAAQNYIDRFYALSIEDQIAIVANKSLKYRPQTIKVITGVQYYSLHYKGKKLGVTYRLDEIASFRKLYPMLRVEKSVVKEMAFEKNDYELNKHLITTVGVKPKNALKTDIITNFKCVVTKRK